MNQLKTVFLLIFFLSRSLSSMHISKINSEYNIDKALEVEFVTALALGEQDYLITLLGVYNETLAFTGLQDLIYLDITDLHDFAHYLRLKLINQKYISLSRETSTESKDLQEQAVSKIERESNAQGFDLKLSLKEETKLDKSLSIAIKRNYCGQLKLLLQKNAQAFQNFSKNKKTHFLFFAIEKNYSKLVNLLLQADNLVDEKNHLGQTALFVASVLGHEEIVDILIEHGANINKTNIKLNQTALMIASLCGYTQIVKKLLQAKADPNLEDSQGRTALSAAVLKDNLKIAKMLIDFGAQISKPAKKSFDVRTLALKNNNRQMLQLLSQNKI